MEETNSFSFLTKEGCFFICDEKTTSFTKITSSDYWNRNSQSDKRRVSVYQGLLVVSAMYKLVKGDLRILSEKPSLIEKSDHIVEASLVIFSGNLIIKNNNIPETAFTFSVPNATYRVRITSQNAAIIDKESYIIEIWKEELSKTLILKNLITE
jgi:hypothetical protein